jgi:uncharacterized protein YpiB (UPF0302 family)
MRQQKKESFCFKKERIATTDMIKKCIRINGNSSDKNSSEIKFRNVYKSLKDRLAIQKVILTVTLMETTGKYIKKH